MVYETFVSFYTMSHDLKICLLPGFVFKGKKKKVGNQCYVATMDVDVHSTQHCL